MNICNKNLPIWILINHKDSVSLIWTLHIAIYTFTLKNDWKWTKKYKIECVIYVKIIYINKYIKF